MNATVLTELTLNIKEPKIHMTVYIDVKKKGGRQRSNHNHATKVRTDKSSVS